MNGPARQGATGGRALRVHHTTVYDYGAPVAYGLQRLRMAPRSDGWQTVRDWRVSLDGADVEARFDDEHGNDSRLAVLRAGVRQAVVTVAGTVETHVGDGVYGGHDAPAPLALYRGATPLTIAGAGVARLARGVTGDLAGLHALSARILDKVAFDTGVPAQAQAAETIVEQGRGVCQDHTHIMLACARHLGLPARYVSGYLLLDDRTEQEAGHAWAEVHLDAIGWVGFDVSNGYSPDTRYVRLATGRDSREAAPVQGLVFGQPSEHLSVRLRVEAVSSQQQ